MRLILPVAMALCLLLSITCAPAQSVQAVALANSLQQDFCAAQALLDKGQTPWPNAQARPQPEPINALRAELPGNCIWAAFKPVDCAARASFRQQRKMYVDKDSGLIDRRTARTGIDELSAAVLQERPAYPKELIRCARRQVLQVDDALEHSEYHAAECALWSLADRLGLWDRQAALEAAACHLAALRERAMGCKTLSPGQVRYYKNQLGCLAVMVQRAVDWKPAACDATPPNLSPCHCPPCHPASDPCGESSLQAPERNTYDLWPCAVLYRDWQYALHDYNYGWLVYTHSAANGIWRPHGDWRELEPTAFWPAAKGSEVSGGL